MNVGGRCPQPLANVYRQVETVEQQYEIIDAQPHGLTGSGLAITYASLQDLTRSPFNASPARPFPVQSLQLPPAPPPEESDYRPDTP
jgi:hypothetical protein